MMPSEKLIMILRSKTDLTDEQIIPLTDEEGWAKVYEAEAAAKAERDANRKPTVLFSGFNKADKAEMEAHAVAHGLKPVTTVTKKLECLVLGEMPGEKKLMKAEELGIKTIHAHEYLQLYGDQ